MGSEPQFKEVSDLDDLKFFSNQELQCLLCKPKLLPMKTVTMEKLEQMQREAERLMRATDGDDQNALVAAASETQPIMSESSGDADNDDVQKEAEVWTAD